MDPNDQEKTTFTCPFGVFSYRRMPFGLCNAPATFQRCMMAIFADMVEKCIEVFMGFEDQKIDFDFFVEDKPAPEQNVCLQVMEVGQEVLEVRTKT